MSQLPPGFDLLTDDRDSAVLQLTGDWVQGQTHRDFQVLKDELVCLTAAELVVDGSRLGRWDSILMAFLLQSYNQCLADNIRFTTRDLPEGVEQLLTVATTVPTHEPPRGSGQPWYQALHPGRLAEELLDTGRESLAFLGELSIALWRLALGRANTRFSDFRQFCYQAGPNAFGIISLTSVLVGMILAYLGAVQLRQLGAEIYVADLVVIGMLREMGVLMAAIVMAGRTGAAYAAQLGTMQGNEEIDAISTMGISPMEFLVVPRLLALVVMMPLLTLYANLLGVIGGGIVAGGMGITPLMYIAEGESALSLQHLGVGLVKSVVFGLLIAVAGCRSGINSGRSSAAVGQAATEAVVTAIVYLIVADAAINIICQQLDI
ncbi:STAS domain-containing protein [Seongchinamella sediminis]|uniref:STAS domain-containing protein n=1 Tax=Seongchinamella sediminis TaxID=2283635 RepID=A0A3L7DWK5_9GAMM|nr:ABC transporter permease [Seongchinamella sediminis]RLQ21947.1 STAS domain-containing protein [Seongchinamella sediminis]